jgi:hypothetical protein
MSEERRAEKRGPLSAYSNPLYRALRASIDKAGSLVGALGIFLVGGLIIAAIGTGFLVLMADHVREGGTLAFDDSVMRWMGAHQ